MFNVLDMKKEMKGKRSKGERAEEMLKDEEYSRGMPRRKFMEGGKAAWKRSKETSSPFQKVEEVTQAIGADDQGLYL